MQPIKQENPQEGLPQAVQQQWLEKPKFTNNLDLSFTYLTKQNLLQYRLNSDILLQTGISEMQRFILRDYLIQTCANSNLSKITSSLACYLVDFAFSKGFYCKIKQFQVFGLACLLIANKRQDCKSIKADIKQQDKVRLLNFEQKIYSSLDYKICPITFIQIGQALLLLWTKFMQIMKKEPQLHSHLNLNEIPQILRNLLCSMKFPFDYFTQFMGFVFHDLSSLNIRLDSLVYNAFFLIICLQVYKRKQDLNSSAFVKFQNLKEQGLVMKKFALFCESCDYDLDISVDKKMLQYLIRLYSMMLQSHKSPKFDCIEESLMSRYDVDEDMSLSIKMQTHFFTNNRQAFEKYLNVRGQILEEEKVVGGESPSKKTVSSSSQMIERMEEL